MPERSPGRHRKRVAAVKSESVPTPQTVVYIHGIGNHPVASVLKCQWDMALFGVEMGDRSRMAYWVNREYYPRPLDENCAPAEHIGPSAHQLGTRALAELRETDDEWLDKRLHEIAPPKRGREALARVGRRLLADDAVESRRNRVRSPGRIQVLGVEAEALPLPPGLRKLVTRWLTATFLQDVNDFLFVPERREAMKATLRDRLEAGGGPFVVVAHSQGSMIAWDVLRDLDPAKISVPLFVTIGSPLGLDEVQDVLREFAHVGGGSLPVPRCVGSWFNAADRLDPVALDGNLANDFTPGSRITDVCRPLLNPDSPGSPHSGTGYLRTSEVRGVVAAAVGSGFAQPVRSFVIARDLVDSLEDRPAQRHPVLIQLAGVRGPAGDSASAALDLDHARARIVTSLKSLVPTKQHAAAEIDPLRRYVTAKLTQLEVEALSVSCRAHIDYLWKNSRKSALLWLSTQKIQASAAETTFGADGNGIRWAVLDTGVALDHPHFRTHATVEAAWDCTGIGDPVGGSSTAAMKRAADGHGHGTHVCATVAGEFPDDLLIEGRTAPVRIKGIAPRAKLHVYKVLGNDGSGSDGAIIKALDHIADTNDRAGHLVIHGVNLSLGGPFDPSVYGCGHSPLCVELRRLWGQGVVVCIAAGNDGYVSLQTADGAVDANLDLSINDPANLEEAIAVGSVHKENPHTYGVSFFSSRGPTADGRVKPDVVAPGERVLSARHDFVSDRRRRRRAAPAPRRDAPRDAADFYVEMSGTSMETPHASGALAAFLSVRPEFAGFPDRVKRMLLESCTDLGRDRYIQGRGMLNVLRMVGAV